MMDVTMEKEKRMDCFDNNVIAPITKILKLDKSFYFFKMYNIIYGETSDFLGNHLLDYGEPYRRVGMDAFKEMYHLDYQILLREQVSDFDTLKKRIIENLEAGIPVAVTVDSYWLTWSHFYLDTSMLHTILLLGYDKERDVFVTQDTYLAQERVEVDVDTIKAHYTWVLFLDTKGIRTNTDFTTEEIEAFIKTYIISYTADEIVEPLFRLYEGFNNYRYREEDKKYYKSPDKAYLLIRFIALSWSRFNFSQALKQFATYKKEASFTEVCKKIDMLAVEWEKMRNIFVFLMIRANENNEYIFRSPQLLKMQELIELERSTYQDLIDICNKF